MSANEPQPVMRTMRLEETFTVQNRYGIHARPAALFVKTAGRFACEVRVRKDEIEVSGKSIMGLLTIEGHQGAAIRIITDGPDAEEAMSALRELFEKKFNEE